MPYKTKTPGIYVIKNTQTNHSYVGSTVKLENRWSEHKSYLRKGNHPSPHLQHAWNKYGESAFVFEVVEKCDESTLGDREQFHIDTGNFTYNTCLVAKLPSGRHGGNRRGILVSEKTRDKQSIARRLLWENSEFRRNQIEKRMGRKASDETKRKMSEAAKGKKKAPFTDAHKERISRAFRSLSDEQVRDIRSLSVLKSHSEIARLYNLRPSTVGKIVRRVSYKDVKDSVEVAQ